MGALRRVLYMSGYTANAIVRQGWHDGEMEFLQKPFGLDALGLKVRAVLDGASPAALVS
jgi:DNA-binding response OmpR family regulator